MAGRKAAKVIKVKALPKNMENLEVIQVQKKFPTGNKIKDENGNEVPESKQVTISCLVPQVNNAGVIAYQKYLAENKADENFVAHAIRTAIVDGVALAVKNGEKAEESTLIIPNVSKVRELDETKAFAAKMAEKVLALKAKNPGKKPSEKDLAALLAEMMAN